MQYWRALFPACPLYRHMSLLYFMDRVLNLIVYLGCPYRFIQGVELVIMTCRSYGDEEWDWLVKDEIWYTCFAHEWIIYLEKMGTTAEVYSYRGFFNLMSRLHLENKALDIVFRGRLAVMTRILASVSEGRPRSA